MVRGRVSRYSIGQKSIQGRPGVTGESRGEGGRRSGLPAGGFCIFRESITNSSANISGAWLSAMRRDLRDSFRRDSPRGFIDTPSPPSRYRVSPKLILDVFGSRRVSNYHRRKGTTWYYAARRKSSLDHFSSPPSSASRSGGSGRASGTSSARLDVPARLSRVFSHTRNTFGKTGEPTSHAASPASCRMRTIVLFAT